MLLLYYSKHKPILLFFKSQIASSQDYNTKIYIICIM